MPKLVRPPPDEIVRARSLAKYRKRAARYDRTCGPTWPIRERAIAALNLQPGQAVLDVGCGNGYYGWRMLEAGASFVLGLDPFLLYVMQFEFLRRYAPDNTPHFLLPLADDALTNAPALFDIAVSMGVLYHRASPIEHLQLLWNTLTKRCSNIFSKVKK